MNVWTLVVVLLCVATVFFWYGSSLNDTLAALDGEYADAQLRLANLETRQSELQAELELAGTDSYIENYARTEYNFMMPDEIRFVITDPETLYGTDEIPSR